jgi:translation initiation factor 2B subunit (eIF-2B alpha/beta/delta family)
MPPARDAALTPATQRSVEDLSHDVRRGTYDAKPPAVLAKRVAETLIQVVATADGRATLEEIIASVRAIGGSLAVLKREHLLVGNVARRVLRVIRDEGATCERGDGDGGGESGGGGGGAATKKLKKDVIDTAHEVIEEMETVSTNIASQSSDFVTNGCVVMTMGSNASAGTGLAEAFLRDANKKRSASEGGGGFSVVVAESAPRYDGHAMAKSLAERGVRDVSLICDSAVYATMPSVKLCVLSARGVLADGSALVDSGAYNIALAAKAHSVPVLMLAGSYAISPKTQKEAGFDRVYGFGSPSTALGYGERGADPDAVVINPSFEFVPAELISVFVTDHGAHCPGFINVLLSEMYSPLDSALLGV